MDQDGITQHKQCIHPPTPPIPEYIYIPYITIELVAWEMGELLS